MAYRDSSGQRERARRATQVFTEHAQRFHGRPQESEHRWARNEWQTPEEQAPAMSFVVPDPDTGTSQIVQRAPSALKRAARFRDGLPPPPLPQPESAYPQYTPPPRAQLLDQRLVDQGITQPFQQARAQGRTRPILPPPPAYQEHAVFNTGVEAQMIERVQFAQPVQYQRPPGPYPLIPDDLEEQEAPLSPSQKKRRRRQKAQAAKRGAPFPLPADQPLASTPQQTKPRQNGVHPTPGLENAPRVCGDEVLAETRPGGPIIRLRCGITQLPHTGQAHIMQIETVEGQRPTDVFVGWWRAGE